MKLLARAILAISCMALSTSQAQVDERAMKAAFLYNFAVFTSWPSPPREAVLLCVLGSTPLDDALAGLQGKTVRDGTPLTVRHVMGDDALDACQLLYIGEHQRRNLDSVLSRLEGRPVLTVTDASGPTDSGVMIEMRKQGQRIAFDVNLAAARKAQLDFSARLLRLAAFVARDS